MDDQLLAYLKERNAAGERQWVAFPRYRQRHCFIVKFRCGHSVTSSGPLTSGLQRCGTCWELQPIDAIHQPRFWSRTEPSKGRVW